VDKVLHLIGMAYKAGSLAAGEEPVSAVCRAKDCRLLLVARDAADNTRRRAESLAEQGACLLLPLPYTREELGSASGRTACALAALTDLGFAQAVAEALTKEDPERYGPAAERLRIKAERARRRRAERNGKQTGRKQAGRKKPRRHTI